MSETRPSITEKDGVHKVWYEQADKVVFQRRGEQDKGKETLFEFMERVMDGYTHDYGTVCHAIAACAVAAAWAANRMDGSQGGITGFQSGAVMWEFIGHWSIDFDGPAKLINFKNMLYPQYRHKFDDRTISAETWKYLQEEAAKLLIENPSKVIGEGKDSIEIPAPGVRAHWKSIVDGVVPFGWSVTPEKEES